jgi:hypothetical protein
MHQPGLGEMHLPDLVYGPHEIDRPFKTRGPSRSTQPITTTTSQIQGLLRLLNQEYNDAIHAVYCYLLGFNVCPSPFPAPVRCRSLPFIHVTIP